MSKVGRQAGRSYGDFFLGDHHGAVFPSDTKRGDVGRGNRLKCIFYDKETSLLEGGTAIIAELR